MRIVTRPDFDGVVCAVLLTEAENITVPIAWVQPSAVQQGRVPIFSDDIIANLPYRENCAMWFDHHFTNQPTKPFKGAFRMAPSAARIIFEYYQKTWSRDYTELIDMTDKIDAADLSRGEVEHPEDHPYVLLSMTINGRDSNETPYWNRLVDLAGSAGIDAIMADTEVKRRCRQVVTDNRHYRQLLLDHTHLNKHVAITDFRSLSSVPEGNRFLAYVLFSQAVVSMRIRYDEQRPDHIIVNVGHSIFNPHCRVNVGHMLTRFEGGGHAGAGSCNFHQSKADENLAAITAILVKNEPNV